jgi:hypothetical protein
VTCILFAWDRLDNVSSWWVLESHMGPGTKKAGGRARMWRSVLDLELPLDPWRELNHLLFGVPPLDLAYFCTFPWGLTMGQL